MIIEVYRLDNPLYADDWFCKDITIVEESDLETLEQITGDKLFGRILVGSIKPAAGDHDRLIEKVIESLAKFSTIKEDEALYRWGHKDEFYI